MKRDMDLIRALLLIVESTPANEYPGDVEPEGYSEDEVLEHLEMLVDAGFLEGKPITSSMGTERILHMHVVRLTWEGREFVDAVRSDAIWQKTKAKVVETGGSFTIDLLKSLANFYLQAHLGLPL
jgi:hypothetical protein